ncbi:hypothetical protein PoB_003345400 [Plakobranchus ocellatus]|uniref:Uncharacterized protein n=1 Tax=Plakobranchus ocellatus TaxID=259542 RepID=A0AAV4AGZ3_9GAST|nr:hypothetical protein PoB_003345400 [Plakobranchus ocellatus]
MEDACGQVTCRAKELEHLGDKINKLEDRCFSQGDRLQKIDSVESKVRSQEDALLARIGTLETVLTARVSKLEDRLSPTALHKTTDMANADTLKALEEIELFDSCALKLYMYSLQDVICERGMGNGVTKNLPPYLVMTNQMLQKEVLCDTHTQTVEDGLEFRDEPVVTWTSTVIGRLIETISAPSLRTSGWVKKRFTASLMQYD